MIIILAFLADVHLGTKLKKIDYLNSLNEFIGLIKVHKEPCDCIFVLGDLFDHKLNIDEATFASVFLLNLVCNNCGRNGKTHVPVHFIHGTASHDNNQYDIFLPILSKIDNVDIFYAKDNDTRKLPNGMSVLYLPQLYGDIDYEELFNKHYNIIIGHGPISSKLKSPCKSSHYEITHSVEKLSEISDICVFGHYHEYTDFGNGVYYNGSMLRWMYGEDTPKCFMFCDNNYNVQTHVNPYALEYKTIQISDPEQLRDIISTDIKTPHRFVIDQSDSNMDTYHAIMATNKNNTNIKFQIKQIDDIIQPSIIDPINDKNDNNIVDDDITSDPILSLIAYINDIYKVDVTDEIHQYENKINKKEEE